MSRLEKTPIGHISCNNYICRGIVVNDKLHYMCTCHGIRTYSVVTGELVDHWKVEFPMIGYDGFYTIYSIDSDKLVSIFYGFDGDSRSIALKINYELVEGNKWKLVDQSRYYGVHPVLYRDENGSSRPLIEGILEDIVTGESVSVIGKGEFMGFSSKEGILMSDDLEVILLPAGTKIGKIDKYSLGHPAFFYNGKAYIFGHYQRKLYCITDNTYVHYDKMIYMLEYLGQGIIWAGYDTIGGEYLRIVE